MGGVLGGEDLVAAFTAKECVGRRSSSSSSGAAKFGVLRLRSRRLEDGKKEMSGPIEVLKYGCRRGLMGEDCVSWLWRLSAHETWPGKDLWAVGDIRYRFAGLDRLRSLSKEAR